MEMEMEMDIEFYASTDTHVDVYVGVCDETRELEARACF